MAVVVNIAADYDSSGVKAAQTAFANFGQTMQKTLTQAAQAARKSLKDVDQAAGDTRTSAQRLADAIGNTADKLEGELKASSKAADALAKALGPEFAAKVGRNGINQLVTQFTRAGVTLKEITDEAETLATAIRRVDDVNLSAVTAETERLDTAMESVGKETDKTKSVVANFAGNAVQEIPGISGAIGPLNVALGQFAEYATEGDIKLSKLAGSIGPLLGAGAALALIQSKLANVAETKAFNKENVDAYTQSLREGATAVEAIRDRMSEVGGAQARVLDTSVINTWGGAWVRSSGAIGGIVGKLFDKQKTVDVTADLTAVGLNADKVARLIAQGKPRVNEFLDALRAAGVQGTTYGNVAAYLSQATDNLATSTKAATVATQFGLDTTVAATSATQIYANTLDILGIRTGVAADQAARHAREVANTATNIDNARTAVLKSISAQYAYESAQLAAEEAVKKAAAAEAKAAKTRDPKDIAAATKARDDAKRAALEYAGAAGQLEEATDKSASADTHAKNVAVATADAYGDLANTVGKDSVLYKALDDLRTKLLATAGDYGINITVSTTGNAPRNTGSLPLVQNAQTWRDWVPSVPMPAMTGSANGWSAPQSVVNITVNGAIDPAGTAKAVAKVQEQQNQRTGVSNSGTP